MILPEGIRSIDGTLGDFKKLFAILSKELNAPIVPLTTNGSYQALPVGRIIPRPFQQVSVTFQQHIFPEDHTCEALTDKVYQKVRARIH